MEITKKQIVWAFVAVVVGCSLAGVGLAWLTRGPPAGLPSGSQSGSQSGFQGGSGSYGSGSYDTAQKSALMEAAEAATVRGKAVCSSCSLNLGPDFEHHVYLVRENPFQVFEVLPNEQRDQLEEITGQCAAGNYEVVGTGKIGVSEGRNTILLSRFTARQIAPGSTKTTQDN